MKNIHPEFMFHRGSTPLLAFGLPEGFDANTNSVWVTFAQNWRTVMTIYDSSSDLNIDGDMVYVQLQDTDTRQFDVGDVEAQVHYKSNDGTNEDHSNEIYGKVLRTQEDEIEALIRGTTPTHTFDIGMEESFVSGLTVSYSQNGSVIVQKAKAQCSFAGEEVNATLTKEETLRFAAGQIISIKIEVATAGGQELVDDSIRIPCR
jgi:hypothetical protein